MKRCDKWATIALTIAVFSVILTVCVSATGAFDPATAGKNLLELLGWAGLAVGVYNGIKQILATNYTTAVVSFVAGGAVAFFCTEIGRTALQKAGEAFAKFLGLA